MSKFLLISFSFFLLVLAVYPVLAQDATTSTIAREKLLQRAKEVREAKKEKVEQRITIAQENQASREAKLKAKLATFRNKEKATAAARISSNLNMINQNQTAQMQKHLVIMSGILDKLETRVNQGSPDIKDPAAAKTAIASARQSWASASAAIFVQAQKDYTIIVSTEAKVKTDAKNQRDKLHTDLQILRKLVVDAKQGVANAIRAAKSGKEATSSGQQ